MESSLAALLNTLGSATFTEIGDKTQLLAFLLASRFRKPIPLLAGIFVGTLANGAIAVLIGCQADEFLSKSEIQWVLILGFAVMAIWVMIPESLSAVARNMIPTTNALLAATVGTFIAEIGDKTELMGVVYGARFDAYFPVVIGLTAGSLMADIPAVLGGCWIGRRIDSDWLRYVAAGIFALQASLIVAAF